ncbi:hypothetical protein A9Q99_17910 [Gammaproteobacteria bacterium 45_16_T64]|nr:hypothetical protein A9Q99_17910 [Gammaproteobacteria bacterium 45_16_T64]
MLQDKSIVIIQPYFGTWPEWMPFYIESCRWNPSIDWLVYTDCPKPANYPSNMTFIDISFEDYKKMASEKLGTPFNPTSAYKLCDIKPTYGLLHEDEISQYDYFAFGDLDLVYGDIRKHIAHLKEYDLISTHDTRVSGHLCFHKNTKKMREAFKQSPVWESSISSEKHVAFDEKAYSKIFLRRKNWPQSINNIVAQCFPYQRNCLFSETFSTPNCRIPWVDGSFDFPEEWIWENGIITTNNTDRDFMYFHFFYWKEHAWPKNYISSALESQLSDTKQPLTSWKITSQGFFDRGE